MNLDTLMNLVANTPLEFIAFAVVLVGVALLHRHALPVAVIGLITIAGYKVLFAPFKTGEGLSGLLLHLGHEWVILSNLLALLVGFALLSRHVEQSDLPKLLPKYLPDDWKGGFVLLLMVFVLSAFLDNIAAALIGGTLAHTVFRGRVHIGYLAAIVAASNAGGSGSVVGDTTTTMMWIDGVAPTDVLHAYVAAGSAMLIFGVPAAMQQQRWSPILKHQPVRLQVDWLRVGVALWILALAITVNVLVNLNHPEWSDRFPILGATVWLAILLAMPLRSPDWSQIPGALRGALFLLALVTIASMMPVEHLPAASWQTAFGLGFVSAVFDNIPLTALALKQGGYDWGVLAYAVGFGGSMIWFGSSAGVALTSMYPEGRSAWQWLRHGWHVALGYVVGFAVLMLVLGWQPHATLKSVTPSARVIDGSISRA